MMRLRSLRRPLYICALTLLPVLSGCDDPVAPFEPEITSATDNFQFQATGVTAVTSTLTYSWANTGTRATVNHSTTTSAGSAQLIIRDAAGATVYDKGLVASLNEPTIAGRAGTWTVQVRLTNFSGTLNFRAQKL